MTRCLPTGWFPCDWRGRNSDFLDWTPPGKLPGLLVSLLVILDPIGTAAVFVGITPRDTEARRRAQAIRATIISVVVLVGFAFIGEFLLRAMGISLPAFQIAGGLLLFVLAFDMVMQRPSGLRANEAERSEAEASDDDVSVFPLAIPLIAGPGAMTSVVLLRGRAGSDPRGSDRGDGCPGRGARSSCWSASWGPAP